MKLLKAYHLAISRTHPRGGSFTWEEGYIDWRILWVRRERKGVGKFIRECMDLKGREKRGVRWGQNDTSRGLNNWE